MKRKHPASYEIIGCDHRFVPSDENTKYCNSCRITRDSDECKVNIMVGERCFVYKKKSY